MIFKKNLSYSGIFKEKIKKDHDCVYYFSHQDYSPKLIKYSNYAMISCRKFYDSKF